MLEEASGGPTADYITFSELEKLMEDNIKAAVEIATKRVVTKT